MATGYARVTRLLLLCCDRRSCLTTSSTFSFLVPPSKLLFQTVDVHHAPWLV